MCTLANSLLSRARRPTTRAVRKPFSEGSRRPGAKMFSVGDIVTGRQFRRPSKVPGRLGTEIKGGVARVTAVHPPAAAAAAAAGGAAPGGPEEEGSCDVNFYLEGRRVRGVPYIELKDHAAVTAVPAAPPSVAKRKERAICLLRVPTNTVVFYNFDIGRSETGCLG